MGVFELILLQRGDPGRYSMPGEEIWGIIILVGIGIVMLIIGIIRTGVDTVKESLKEYSPEELAEKEKNRVLYHNQKVHYKYQSELNPMIWKLQAYNRRIEAEKSEKQLSILMNEKAALEKDYEYFLNSKGFIGQVGFPR